MHDVMQRDFAHGAGSDALGCTRMRAGCIRNIHRCERLESPFTLTACSPRWAFRTCAPVEARCPTSRATAWKIRNEARAMARGRVSRWSPRQVGAMGSRAPRPCTIRVQRPRSRTASLTDYCRASPTVTSVPCASVCAVTVRSCGRSYGEAASRMPTRRTRCRKCSSTCGEALPDSMPRA